MTIRPQIRATQLSPKTDRRFPAAADNSIRYQVYISEIAAYKIIPASSFLACNEGSAPAGVRLRDFAHPVSQYAGGLLLIIPRYAVTTCETGHYILNRIRSDV